MKTKSGDTVELDYVGMTKDNNEIFDFTNLEIMDIKDQKKLKPKIVKIGEEDLLKGLDKKLAGLEINKIYDFDVEAEEAFGKRDASLIKLISLSEFKKHNVEPQPGMRVNMDGMVATVKTVGGGRVTLDFNHPLAGRDLHYKIKINKIVKDLKEKIQGYVDLAIPETKVEVKDKKVEITTKQKMPDEMKKVIDENLKKRFSEITNVKIITKA